MEVNDYKENYSDGWLKSYRSTIHKGWYKKSEYFHLWHHLLYRANHKGIEFMFAGKNIKLNPVAVGIDKMALCIKPVILYQVQRILTKYFRINLNLYLMYPKMMKLIKH